MGDPDSFILDTGISLDYRAPKWGLERIVYDGFSNHFPADSKGTKLWANLVQEGIEIDVLSYDKSQPVSDVYFRDDGKGYNSHLLSVFKSFGKDDTHTTGYYGEGLKLIASASLRHNVEIEFRSRDWRAVPFKRKIDLDNGPEEFLSFMVEKAPPMIGSYTRIKNPSKEILNHVLTIPQRVLFYRNMHEHQDLHANHQVFTNPTNEVFVHNVRFPSRQPLLFSYHFRTHKVITNDRDQLELYGLRSALQEIILNFNAPLIIERLLAPTEKHYMEFDIYEGAAVPKHPKLWEEAFQSIYGRPEKIAILSTPGNPHCDANANRKGFISIKMHRGIASILHNAGVKYSSEVLERNPKYDFLSPNDYTPKQRQRITDLQILDDLLGQKPSFQMKVFKRASNEHGEVDWFNGMTYMNQKIITLSEKRLNGPLAPFVGTTFHEKGHAKSGAVDATLEFEEELTRMVGVFGAGYIEMHKKNLELTKLLGVVQSENLSIKTKNDALNEELSNLALELMKGVDDDETP